MLPAFQIRGLLAADTHVASTEPGEHCPIQLDEPQHYDSLISEEPATTLSYIDQDDGEIITVGSSSELYSRIDELQSLRPVVFDLLASLRSSRDSSETAAEGYRRWIQLVNSKYKGKGKAVEIIDAAPEPPVTPATAAPSHQPPPPPPQKPLLVAFEEELKTLLDAPQQPEPTILDAEPITVTDDSRAAPNPNDLINQAIHSIRWAGECMNKLRTDLPHRAQPAVENLNNAVHGAIVALIGQMQLIAIEATEKARQAAQSTSRQVDMNEIEAAKEKIRQLAVSIGHIAAQTAVATSSAARDIAKDVGEDVAKARRVAHEVGMDVVRGMRVESMERDSPVAPPVNSRPGNIVVNVREALGDIKRTKAKKAEQEKQQEEEAKPETPRAVRFSGATIMDAEPPKPASPTKSVADEIREAVQHIEATNHSMQQARESARSPIRAMASSSSSTSEQRVIAFWEQMDKIAGHAPYFPPPPPAPAVADASDDEDTPSAPPPPPHHASNVPDGVRRSRSWHFPRHHHHRFHNQHPIPPPLPHHLPPNWHHHHPPPPPPPPGPPPFHHLRRSRTVIGSPQPPAPPTPPPALSFFPPEPPVVRTSLPGEWPSERDERSEKIDRCIAQLVEMGFGDATKVRVYAQVAEGEVMEAVELLEDDRKVWEGRRKRLSERFGGIGSSNNTGGV